MTNVDIFADLDTADSAASSATETEQESTPEAESVDTPTDESPEDQSPVETVAQIPPGAVSVTEFAAIMTQTLMRQKFLDQEDLDGSEYVVPQAVYQTVKAQRDRIPHILVKASDDAEARVYILRDEAIEWWKARKERLSTRGQGAQRASSRTPEDNLTLLAEAVKKSLYAHDRKAMWLDRVEQTAKLVDKYKGFLKDAEVAEETMVLAVQEATDQYNTDKAAKEAEKAAKSKKSGTSDENPEDGS